MDAGNLFEVALTDFLFADFEFLHLAAHGSPRMFIAQLAHPDFSRFAPYLPGKVAGVKQAL